MITSPNNKRVAAAVRLKKRAAREKDRRFLVEGARAIGEALASSASIHELFHTSGPDDAPSPDVRRAEQAGVRTWPVSEEIMGRLTSTITPQGLVAVADFVDADLASAVAAGPRTAGDGGTGGCVAILVEVRDPGNAGTILRSADAAGAEAVVFTTSSVDLYNPKTVRASAGSLFHVPVAREVLAVEVVESLRAEGFRILGTAADEGSSVYHTDLSGPVAFLFGNEARGLSEEARALADETVRVPIRGRAESLNLAAAATLLLFESARQRSEPSLARLVAGAAHDIRSPLTALGGFASTLQSRWPVLSEQQRRTMVDAMAFDAMRMEAVVSELLDAARLAGGTVKLSPEPLDVMQVAFDVAEDLNRVGRLDVEVSGDTQTLSADRRRLRTTLFALVEAARWLGDEGPVSVHVSAPPDWGDGAVVRVERRSGLASDERGEAGGHWPSSVGGAGPRLGLFVAEGLASAHGGRVELHRQGTSVRLTLWLPRWAATEPPVD